jgi:hypothetical protein
MKSILTFSIVFFWVASAIQSQNLVTPDNPVRTFSSNPGYITITEFSGGPGLGGTGVPYADYYFGITNIYGYLINESFLVGLGTGALVFNKGLLIPVFVDLRYNIHTDILTPYLFGDCGFAFNPNNVFKIFINPGAGLRIALQKNFALTLGTGMYVQFDNTRDSFINFKLGVIFNPR